MSTSSPHGFVAVRRGYHPAQVDARVLDLQEERDAADQRAAKLTLLARQLTEEAERLGRAVAALQPDTYATLGDRAGELLATVEEEAADIREAAERDAQRTTATAHTDAATTRDTAHDAAGRLREAAETAARQTLHASRADAERILEAAHADAGKIRDEAAETLRDTTERCAALLESRQQEHAGAHDALTRELHARETTLETRLTDLDTRAQKALDTARRAHTEAEEAARHRQEDAEAQAAGILAQARAEATRIDRATDRVLREHAEAADELNAHMAHVRSTLAALTGKTEPEPAAAVPRQTARPDN